MKKLTTVLMMALSSQLVMAQIDLHSHMIPESYLEAVESHGMAMDEGFPIPQWNAESHLEFMDGAGIPVRGYGERMVRLAEIEVYPERLEEYMSFASEVGTVSMATEPGVVGLFSMQDKTDPCKVYILEVYADSEAYQAHLRTAHFKKYKEGTAHMVKSLRLIDTQPLVTAKLNKTAIR